VEAVVQIAGILPEEMAVLVVVLPAIQQELVFPDKEIMVEQAQVILKLVSGQPVVGVVLVQ
jgi:hypothetical protein